VAVYATMGAIVILLLTMTEDYSERLARAATKLEHLWGDDLAMQIVMLGVAAVLLLTWPNLPVAYARRRLRDRRRGG
jgi:uncharacterized membrane protein YhaH (DUF805 family)